MEGMPGLKVEIGAGDGQDIKIERGNETQNDWKDGIV